MMNELSDATAHKLRAALYHTWPTSDGGLVTGYHEALQRWFAVLRTSDREVAAVARAAFDRGDDAEAHKAAAGLPPAPVCPLLLRPVLPEN